MDARHSKIGASFAVLLRRAGSKATPRRLALLRTLGTSRKPLTVEEIMARSKQATNQATIYRALRELTAAGVVRQVDFQHGHAHYELAGAEDHHHLICTHCGKVENFTGCRIHAIAATALKQSRAFKTVTRHSLELFGLCKSCAKKK